MRTGIFEEADIISVYTREQAIKDVVLVDISTTAREAGIKFPTAVTYAVWDKIIEPDKFARSHGETASGRLWDVVYMLLIKIKMGNTGSVINYTILATSGGHKRRVNLKAICGPGDNAEPVITIMLPDED